MSHCSHPCQNRSPEASHRLRSLTRRCGAARQASFASMHRLIAVFLLTIPGRALAVAIRPQLLLQRATVNMAAGPLLRSFGGEGIAFFNQMRTPAALVAAAAIKDAFVMQSAPEDIKRSRGWTLLRELYLLFQLLSFSSELSSVFFATQAIARLQLRPTLQPIDLQVDRWLEPVAATPTEPFELLAVPATPP